MASKFWTSIGVLNLLFLPLAAMVAVSQDAGVMAAIFFTVFGVVVGVVALRACRTPAQLVTLAAASIAGMLVVAHVGTSALAGALTTAIMHTVSAAWAFGIAWCAREDRRQREAEAAVEQEDHAPTGR